MNALGVIVAALLAVVAFDLVRRPSFRRLAARNVVRRRNEAVLVVLGSMLGTAIITASFVVGDTLGASIRDIARQHLGPADVAVRPIDPAQLDAVIAATDPATLPGIDGSLVMTRIGVTAVPVDGPTKGEPHAGLLELDVDAARRFGGDPTETGFADAGPTPTGDEALVGEDLAGELGLDVGEQLVVHAYGTTRTLTVREVLPRRGLAGYGSAGRGSEAPTVVAAPGTIAAMWAEAGGASAARPPDAALLLSIDGGVFDTESASPALEDELERRVGGLPGVEVDPMKRELLEEARTAGASFTELFTGIGGFAVIAGILLLVNIFVMLGEERKPELGVLRAVGLKRNHLVRAFGMEGAFYAVAAAVIGAAVGVAVGRVIVVVVARLFQDDEQGTLELVFAAKPESVVSAMLLGLAISMATIWLTSVRIGRLNVIRAIRDIPDPARITSSVRGLVLGAVGIVVGGMLFAAGVSGRSSLPVLIGPALALFSAIPLLSRLVPRRAAVTIPCALALVWATICFNLVPEAFNEAGIPVFVVEGVILVGAAVAMVTVNTDRLGHLVERVVASGSGLAARLGLAYPLARRFRTGLLLGMYGLVVFTLTFLATMSGIFQAQAPRLTEASKGGFDLIVDSNPSNPVTDELLAAHADVESAVPLVRGFPKFDARYIGEPMYWAASGIDERFVAGGPPRLQSRGPGAPSDDVAWRRVLEHTEVGTETAPRPVIVPDFFLQDGGGPPEGRLRAGETFLLVDPIDGATEVLWVIGVVEGDWQFNGVFLPARRLQEVLPDAVANRHVVKVADGADAEAVADRLNAELIPHGVDAATFRSIIDRGLSQQAGFFNLMQGFLGLGLIIGIAGLGVVMVRAVRERRRQIGMLRAMGFTARVVRRAFVLEAAFIASQGVVIGIGLGLLTSWSVLSNSSAFGDQPLPFAVPWLGLVVLVVVPLAASLLAVAAPANAASRIRPAAALRIAD